MNYGLAERKTTGVPYITNPCDRVSFEQWIGRIGAMACAAAHHPSSGAELRRKDT